MQAHARQTFQGFLTNGVREVRGSERIRLHPSVRTPPKAHIDHVHALAEDTDKYIHIDESRFKGKRVIIIDDIVTTCKTANAFVDRMITAGADVRMVLFLGMTKYFKRYND